MPTLATIGSISPYIGLFGTVWGIMHAFVALAAVKNATLSMVAPPIAEALIATAMGLFAAIPAVMFYNRFTTKLEALENRYLNFMDEFATILNRRLVTIKSASVKREEAQNQVKPRSFNDFASRNTASSYRNQEYAENSYKEEARFVKRPTAEGPTYRVGNMRRSHENNEENSLRSGAPSSLRSLSGRGNINNGQGS